MRTIFQLSILFLAVLMAGCGGNGGGNTASDVTYIEMSGIKYPEIPYGATVKMSKSNFPKGKILSYEQIPIKGLEIINRELDLLITDKYIIIKHLEFRKGAYLVHVVSRKDYSVIAELAPFGEGPNEFYDVRLVQTEEKDKICYVLNLHNERIYALTENLELCPSGNVVNNHNDSIIRCYHSRDLFIGKDLLMTEFDSSEGKGIVSVNQKDSIVTGLIPFNFTKGARGYFYLLDLEHSYHKRKCAVAFLYYDRVGFFDFNGKNSKFICYGNESLNSITSPDNPMYYYDCFSNDNYVFAVYRPSMRNTEKDLETFLEQYDWDGNLIARYELPADRGFFGGYATNESDKVIYLVDIYEDQFLHRVTLEW